MSTLRQGSSLNGIAREQALNQFVHRWTFENCKRRHVDCVACEDSRRADGKYGSGEMNREQWHAYHAPLVSDAQWLADHAFWVTVDGRLDASKNTCEPAYMADLA